MDMTETTQARMEKALTAAFAPTRLRLINDSAKHAGHAGHAEESHFRVEIESAAFTGKSRVERHRMVYAAVQDAFAGGLHALQVKAMAPGEG
jgi:BolA protein